MDKLDQVVDTAGRVARKAALTTGRLADKGREKVNQLALQARLARLHRQLGALVYSLRVNGDENEAMVAWYVAEITQVKKRLAAYGTPRQSTVTAAVGDGVQEDAMFRGGGGA